MPKRKLLHFAEIKKFANCIHLPFEESRDKSFPLKGKWNKDFFKNPNPLILELACGKGEYTVGLAKKFQNLNFIGVDIKGNRIWRGAKTALDQKISNAGFLRSRIDFIENAFEKSEVKEIWITFPDPQRKKPGKRLTSPEFLNRYKNILAENGIVHLKTDSLELHLYTLEILAEMNLNLIESTQDLYGENPDHYSERKSQAASERTHYESIFLKEGKPITYLCFSFS